MKYFAAAHVVAIGAFTLLSSVQASSQPRPIVQAQRVDANVNALPVSTLMIVSPLNEITSKKMKEGTRRQFMVVEDVVQSGYIVIPRGSVVEATVTWRTGKGIVGKSAKFELSFDWVRVGGHNWRLRGAHRQEGKGNTVGALLGAGFISGKSAVMIPGQTVNVFTDEPIPFAIGPQQAETRPEEQAVSSPRVKWRRPTEVFIKGQ